VRPVDVVVIDPLIEGLLGRLEIGERCLVAEEFGAQAAVKPLNLASRSRAARLREQMLDPVFTADRLKKHLGRRVVEPTREDLAVVGQNLLGRPICGQGATQPIANRPSALTGHQPRTDTHPRVIVDAGQRLSAAAIGQREPAHNIHLPQLHRRAAFPAFPLA
jgi:hypothetical protein